MAWLQNLAGQAEYILNKIDKNAANVLQDSTVPISLALGSEELASPNTDSGSSSYLPKSDSNNIENENKASDDCIGFQIVQLENVTLTQGYTSLKNETDIQAENVCGTADSVYCELPNTSDETNCPVNCEQSTQNKQLVLKLESENSFLKNEILETRHSYLQLRNENEDLKGELEALRAQAIQSDLKLKQYRSKAIILSNHTEASSSNSTLEPASNNNLLLKENENLKWQVEFFESENIKLLALVRRLSSECDLLQSDLRASTQLLTDSKSTLDLNNKLHGYQILAAQEESKNKTKIIQRKYEEIKNNLIVLKDKQTEIINLNKTIKHLKEECNENNLKKQIRTLTETLLSKQIALEQTLQEKNAMMLRLEGLQKEIESKSGWRQNLELTKCQKTIKPSVPALMEISYQDEGIKRGLKKFIIMLDFACLKLCAYLKYCPLIRLFIFLYVLLLHAWIVLLLLFISNIDDTASKNSNKNSLSA